MGLILSPVGDDETSFIKKSEKKDALFDATIVPIVKREESSQIEWNFWRLCIEMVMWWLKMR